jgi:peroxisomal 2,4-dienoyl-CoA reductase
VALMPERVRVPAGPLTFDAWSVGEGPRLALLLHGFPDDPGSLLPLAERLAGHGFTAVAPWMRGYGGTGPAPDGRYGAAALAGDVLALIAALGHRRALVVGHDWGAVAGYAAAVRDPDAVAAVIARAVDRFGKLDTLVCGAAGNFLAPAAGLSPNAFKTVVDIDLVGTFHACKAAFEPLKAAGDAAIINITATLHYHGTPLQLHASSAKAGVDALTRNLAVEWGPLGIRVNGIAPGPIGDTEGMRRLAPGALGDKMRAMIPLGRFGAIDEIAQAAVYLASPAAAYITGTVLVVDGGQCVSLPMMGS